MRLATAARLLGSAVLLGLLLWRFSPQELADAFADADPAPIVAAGLLMAVMQAPLIGKWWLLARSRHVSLTPVFATRTYLQASLLNYVLPTGIGGDAYRVYRSREHAETLADATAAVIFDRATGYVGMAALAAVGAAFYFGGPRAGVPALLGMSALGIAVAIVTARLARSRGSGSLLPGRSDVRPLLEAALLSVVIHLIYVTAVMLVGDGFNLDVPWSYWAIVNFLTAMAIVIPISVGGLGIREQGFVGLLGALDVPAAKATSTSLTVAFLLAAVSLVLLAALQLATFLWPPLRAQKAEPATAEATTPQ
jgi:uncharacterized membrane protein YbhN (UPF0104 family)